MGVEYHEIEARDHVALDVEQMDEVAGQINQGFTPSEEGNQTVYVHCRAGVGRSSTGIAAYLMKYGEDNQGQPLSIEAICKGIVGSREKATIWNKLHALVAYDNELRKTKPNRPPVSGNVRRAANFLSGLEGLGEKAKLSKEWLELFEPAS